MNASPELTLRKLVCLELNSTSQLKMASIDVMRPPDGPSQYMLHIALYTIHSQWTEYVQSHTARSTALEAYPDQLNWLIKALSALATILQQPIM